MKSVNYLRLTLCLVLALTMSALQAQQETVSSQSRIYELIKDANVDSPVTLDYKATPGFCYGHRRRNSFINFTDAQLLVLEEYNYPKFSSRGTLMLEADILLFQELVAAWDEENNSRADEIRTKLGFN